MYECIEEFEKVNNIQDAKPLIDFFTKFGNGCEFVFRNSGSILFVSIKKDSDDMGTLLFSKEEEVLTVSLSPKSGINTIPLINDDDYIQLNALLLYQIKGFEKYYAEKQLNFVNAVNRFNRIEFKIKEKIKHTDILFSTKSTCENIRMGYLKYHNNEIAFRLSFDHEGYKMVIIQNDDVQTGFNFFNGFDYFFQSLMYCLNFEG